MPVLLASEAPVECVATCAVGTDDAEAAVSRRRFACAVESLGRVQVFWLVVNVDADLDNAELVVRRRAAREHLAAINQVGRARNPLRDLTARVADLGAGEEEEEERPHSSTVGGQSSTVRGLREFGRPEQW